MARHACWMTLLLLFFSAAVMRFTTCNAIELWEEADRESAIFNKLHELHSTSLSMERQQTLVLDLTEQLTGPHSSQIVATFLKLLARDSHVLDIALPRYVNQLNKCIEANEERKLCDLCRLAASISSCPKTLADQLESLVSDAATYEYAAPLAAAVILKFDSRRSDMSAFIKRRLADSKPFRRMIAASAIPLAGNSGEQFSDILRLMLNDQDLTVRVVVADSLRASGKHIPEAVSILMKSLEAPPTEIFFAPHGVSAIGINHHHLAVRSLGEVGADARDAAMLIATKSSKSSDALFRQIACMSLGNIGDSHPVIVRELEVSARDENSGVSAAAKDALRKISDKN